MTFDCSWNNFESFINKTVQVNTNTANFPQTWALSSFHAVDNSIKIFEINRPIRFGFDTFNSYTLAFLGFQFISKDTILNNKSKRVLILFNDFQYNYGVEQHIMFQRMAQQFIPEQADLKWFMEPDLSDEEIQHQIYEKYYIAFVFSPGEQQNMFKLRIIAQNTDIVDGCWNAFVSKLSQQLRPNNLQKFFAKPGILLNQQNNPKLKITPFRKIRPPTPPLSELYQYGLGGQQFYIFNNSLQSFKKIKNQLALVKLQSIDPAEYKGGQFYVLVPEKQYCQFNNTIILSYFNFNKISNLNINYLNNLPHSDVKLNFLQHIKSLNLQELPQFNASMEVVNGNLEQVLDEHGAIMQIDFFKEFKGAVVTFTIEPLKLPNFMKFDNNQIVKNVCQCLIPYLHCQNDKILKLNYNVDYSTENPGVIFGQDFLKILSTVKSLVSDEIKLIKQEIQEKGASVTNIQNTDKKVDMNLLAQPCQSVHNAYSNFVLQGMQQDVKQKLATNIGYNQQVTQIRPTQVDFEKDYGYSYLTEKNGENEIETTIFQPVVAQPENKEVKVVQ